MVEFTMVIGVFFVVLFGSMSTGIYVVQRTAAITAAATAARAVGGANPADPNLPDLSSVGPSVKGVLNPVLFGSHLVVKDLTRLEDCDPLAQIPSGEFQVCAKLAPDDLPDDPGDHNLIVVTVRARPLNVFSIAPIPWTIEAPAAYRRPSFGR